MTTLSGCSPIFDESLFVPEWDNKSTLYCSLQTKPAASPLRCRLATKNSIDGKSLIAGVQYTGERIS